MWRRSAGLFGARATRPRATIGASMKVDQLRLDELPDEAAWDTLVDASPQGCVFARAAFLQALGLPHRRLAVWAGARPVALVPVVETTDGRAMQRPPFTPHLGILLLPDAQAPLARQRIDDAFTLSEWLAAELTRRYQRVELALHWTFDDVRALQWHNYHDAAAGQFRLTPRYTALLPLAGQTPASLRAAARACRRQEEKKAAAGRLVDAPGLDRFLDLYERTFARQDITLPGESVERVGRLAEAALHGGWGRLAGIEVNGELAAATLFVHDRHTSYYLFAANDPAHRNSGAATRLMFHNLDDALARGLQGVDFVGVNSPNRGDFKLSFNPELKLYFDASWVAPGQAEHAAA